jgi:hypothetical protein
MTIVIVSWVCLSTLFVLALLGAAARPMPHRHEEFAAVEESSREMPSSKPFPASRRLATSSQSA